MKIKFNRNKTVSCKLVWKRRIVSEKGFSEKRAERIAQRCIDLIERMQYGTACMEKIYDREPARMESDCVTLIKEFER